MFVENEIYWHKNVMTLNVVNNVSLGAFPKTFCLMCLQSGGITQIIK